MIVFFVDLLNLDKIDGFLKKIYVFIKDDFIGVFLQVGVFELIMVCCCLGMVFYGGVIVVCVIFFVFLDYMKFVICMVVLMEFFVKFIWIYDVFCVGEDGFIYELVE